jgi:hypothetical protein
MSNQDDRDSVASHCSGSRKWRVGDRVKRRVFMDDGTWSRRGDSCLEESPWNHGTVKEINPFRDDKVVVVFDDGSERVYLAHGISASDA